ncbi:MAG: hypothetical protein ACTSWR_00715 [Candidatus Helarchaeota archaeon]
MNEKDIIFDLKRTEFLLKHGLDKFYSKDKKFYDIDKWITKNYKILRDKVVSLGPFTWLLGIFEFKPDKIRYVVLYTIHDSKLYIERLVGRKEQFEYIKDETEWRIAVYFVRNFTHLLDPSHIMTIFNGLPKSE